MFYLILFKLVKIVQAPVGSSATGRGNYRHVFFMSIGAGNKKKLGKRAGVGAFG